MASTLRGANLLMKSKTPLYSKLSESRHYEMILYPSESDSDRELLSFIQDHYEYCACTHDKDFLLNEDETEVLVDVHGEVLYKKPHTHVIVYFANQRKYTSVSKIFGKYAMPIASLPKRVKYLIHFDEDPALKPHYPPEFVFGDKRDDIYKFIKSSDSDIVRFQKAFNFIVASSTIVSYTALVDWALKEGVFDVVRKNAYIFLQLCREHNNRISNNGSGSE